MDAHENPVYQNICNPVTKEFRDTLYGAILESYETGKDVNFTVETKSDQPEVGIKVVPLEQEGSRKALARMSINDSFVVNNISLQENKEGTLFMSMPSKATGSKGYCQRFAR